MSEFRSRRQSYRLRALLGVMACSAAVFGSWNHASGQFGGGGGGSEPLVKSFALEHADVGTVANALKILFADRALGGNARIAVDYASSQLLVAASEEQMLRIEEVLKSLDVAPAKKEARELRAFRLRHVPADKKLASLLSGLFVGQATKIAIDEPSNTILARGDSAALQAVQALLVLLDKEPAKTAGTELRVRVVWLVSGLSREDAPLPPEDLNEVVDELAKLGIDGLRVAAQTVLTTVGQQQPFQLQCTALLDEPCTLNISGIVTDRQGTPGELQLRVSADGEPSASGTVESLCQLETTIRAPLNHSVVLGVTPIVTPIGGSMTSAFVVQLIPTE